MSPDQAGQQSAESWWSHNWKWVVPVGCLAPVLLLLLVVATAFSFMKRSTPYTQALDSARVDCGVQQALGTPVEAGWMVSGSVNVSGPSGHAELAIPLQGSRAKGTLYVTATKAAGQWRFDLLQVGVEGRGERIDLLSKNRQPCN